MNTLITELKKDLCINELTSAHHDVFEKYYSAFEKYNPLKSDDKIIEMLKRRFFIPLNLPDQSNGILIVGANPSVNDSEKENIKNGNFNKCDNFMQLSKKLYSEDDTYWKDVAPLAKDLYKDSQYMAAYLDLFPIKQTTLGEFEKTFRKHADIRAKLLQVTHDRMVALCPKVIINQYSMTSYYWGFNPNSSSTDYCNERHPWMGYKFRPLNFDGLDAFEIIGWLNSKNSIIPNDEKKRLPIGTIIVFSTKIWNKEIREKKMITREKLISLLEKHNIKLGESGKKEI